MKQNQINLKPATVDIVLQSCRKCIQHKGISSCSYRKMNDFCPSILTTARFYESLREMNE